MEDDRVGEDLLQSRGLENGTDVTSWNAIEKPRLQFGGFGGSRGGAHLLPALWKIVEFGSAGQGARESNSQEARPFFILSGSRPVVGKSPRPLPGCYASNINAFEYRPSYLRTRVWCVIYLINPDWMSRFFCYETRSPSTCRPLQGVWSESECPVVLSRSASPTGIEPEPLGQA